MGADLYRNSISEPAYEKYYPEWEKLIQSPKPDDEEGQQKRQEALDRLWDLMYPDEGYFRDSYNNSSVLWTLGLSWWGLELDDDGYMGGEKLKEFRNQVANATQIIPDKIPEDKKAEATKYFQEKRQRLIAFLDGAINAGERVMFSV